MTKSMTGFAAAKGEVPGWSWAWDIDPSTRAGLISACGCLTGSTGWNRPCARLIQKALARGNVSLSLKVQRDDTLGALAIEHEVLDHVLATIKRTKSKRRNHNAHLAPTCARPRLWRCAASATPRRQPRIPLRCGGAGRRSCRNCWSPSMPCAPPKGLPGSRLARPDRPDRNADRSRDARSRGSPRPDGSQLA